MKCSSLKKLDAIFLDDIVVSQIQKTLPKLFQMAEDQNSKNGKLGMNVGSTREKILIGILITHLGEENIIETNINEKEVDIIVFEEPISIKTISRRKLTGVKMAWVVDKYKALEFVTKEKPKCHLLLVHINWGGVGGIYLISKKSQLEEMKKLGRDEYFKLPKEGTNCKGVEITSRALLDLISKRDTKYLPIEWNKIKNDSQSETQKWKRIYQELSNF